MSPGKERRRVERPERILPLLDELDPSSDCTLEGCPTDHATASANVEALGKWWLSAGARKRWGHTFLEAPTETPNTLSINFMLGSKDGGPELPVFQALFQHWKKLRRRKRRPHYQLYVPSRDIRKRLSGEDASLKKRVEEFETHAVGRVNGILYRRKKSIDLHGELPPERMATIRSAVSELADSLNELFRGKGG